MIPTAAGIGGEVIVACTECQKVKYIIKLANECFYKKVY